VNAEIDLHALALGSGFNEAANGGGGEALSADEGGDVWLAKDEAEVDFIFTGVANAEFGELWVADKLEGNVLDEVFDLCGDFFHGEEGERKFEF